MQIKNLVVGPIDTNCYIVSDDETKNCLIVDPGDEPDKIECLIEEDALTLLYIVNTHGHGDHIMGNNYFKDRYPSIKILVHKEDVEMLENPALNLSGHYISYKPDRILNDNDIIEFDNIKFTVFHTPGHTKGCICLSCDKHLFSGDTLFNCSVGRTDLPGGSSSQILKSIKDKLFCLDDDTTVYPGHGNFTSIKDEKLKNPFF